MKDIHRMSSASDDIRVIPFEARHQPEVQDLFRAGLTGSYLHKSKTIQMCQQWFVNNKLSPEGGDMADIASSFMSDGDNSCRYFWVAVDGSDRVVGHVGLVPSTYGTDTPGIYDDSQGITLETVGELVRMSVHKDTRGKGVGRKLCDALEAHAALNGMKRVVLSTLTEMDMAVGLYRKCGYTLCLETPLDVRSSIGEGDWDDLTIAHFSKDLNC